MACCARRRRRQQPAHCLPTDLRTQHAAARCRSHANGLALALLLGVDGAILPPAVCRRTFNVSLDHLTDLDLWAPRPLGSLLDLPRMQEHWRAHHGIELQEARAAVGRLGGMPAAACPAGGAARSSARAAASCAPCIITPAPCLRTRRPALCRPPPCG